MSLRTITMAEVEAKKYIVIDGDVYDVSKFYDVTS
jgi:hypothetical protein